MSLSIIKNIVELAKENRAFRQEVVTGEHSQVVVMTISPGMDIGEETHSVDQILFFVGGRGTAVIDSTPNPVDEGYMVFVPAGTKHNIINSDDNEDLKLFTVYAPIEHEAGVIHRTKEDADNSEHH